MQKHINISVFRSAFIFLLFTMLLSSEVTLVAARADNNFGLWADEIESSAEMSLLATIVPQTKLPNGTIADRTPTFKWTKVPRSTAYQIQVWRGSTKINRENLNASACGTTFCAKTPKQTLSNATYKWRVRAKIADDWKSWSAFRYFTVKILTPTPISPGGNTFDQTPKFIWTKILGATRYQFQVRKGSTLVHSQSVTASACGTTRCSRISSISLAANTLRWRIRAKVDGEWRSWSAYKSFTVTAGTWWQPLVGASWQWQLDGKLDLTVPVEVYDIDLFDSSAKTVAKLHSQGRKVICYISVGSWENWRPDSGQFPKSVLGKNYDGWPGERWLDIRKINLLAPIMRARLDKCKQKGFDGIEPDNMDAYSNNTGFPLTYEDQLAYNIWLASEAHKRGLSIGLKNNPQQVDDLLPYFDWAITEDCFDQSWCKKMLTFINDGKPVFAAEYTDTGITLNQFCSKADNLKFSAILKKRNLKAFVEFCP